jgi:hypothetical protein
MLPWSILERFNTGTFLRGTPRAATPTFFSFQGTMYLFFVAQEKTEMQGLKPRAPNQRSCKPRGLRRVKTLHCQQHLANLSVAVQC